MKRLWLALLLCPALVRATDVTVACVPTLTGTQAGVQVPLDPTLLTFTIYGSMVGQPLVPLANAIGLTVCSSRRLNLDVGVHQYSATQTYQGHESALGPTVTFTVAPPPPPIIVPAPPGAVTVTPVTVATTVYMELQTPNGFGFLAVGTVPLGTPCDPNQRVNNFNVVPRELVTWTGKIQRLAALAACSIT